MNHTGVALTITTLLLAGTPVLAKPKLSVPPTYLPSVVMPYDAYAPIFVAPMPEPRKNTGAANNARSAKKLRAEEARPRATGTKANVLLMTWRAS